MALQTIANPVQVQQKIRRSLFHGFLFPCADAETAKALISAHAKEYSSATHNCFAYICGYRQEIQYYSDSGEPHGTAGKPLLNALRGAELTNVLAIVSRYYGGVKLGVPGLIEAYGSTAEQAVAQAELIPAIEQSRFIVIAEYALVEQLSCMVQSLQGTVLEAIWTERAELTLLVPVQTAGKLKEFLDGLRRQSRLDYRYEET